MATFIQLCQRVRQEAGITGSGPVTVLSQSGEYRRVVDWVAAAWEDIQIAEPDWRWMSGEFSFLTTPGQGTYTATQAGIASRFDSWRLNSIRMGLTPPNDQIKLAQISFDEYRAVYQTGPQPLGRPVAVSETMDMKLALGNTPDAAYTVVGEYKKAPQTLALDADVPEMPSQFHTAIVYRALMMYGRYENAAEVFQDAQSNYSRIMTLLRQHQLPMFGEAEPLA